MSGVGVAKVAQILDLCNFIPQMELKGHRIMIRDVNRPALQLTGFFDHFDKDRVQIIGYVENAYISTLTPQRRREMFDKLLSSGIPCLVYSRGMAPEEEVLELCNSILISTEYRKLAALVNLQLWKEKNCKYVNLPSSYYGQIWLLILGKSNISYYNYSVPFSLYWASVSRFLFHRTQFPMEQRNRT